MVVNNETRGPVMEKELSGLLDLGFTEYEGKVYLSLLRENPASAYEIGKASGVPTSKIYEVLKKLAGKGIITVIDDGKTKRYVPAEPEEFLDRYRSRTVKILDDLRLSLTAARGERKLSQIWNIREYEYLIDKTRRMIENACASVLLSVWREELALLEDVITEALHRKVKVVIVHFGPPELVLGRMYHHPIEDTLYQEKGGRGMTVVTDSREVLMGTISEDHRVEGAWSQNGGFVMMAEDYIKHDVYIMKIVGRFEQPLKERYGERYERLRDIYQEG
jgi:HTH-type transcriptional regulator, sugar sensing transcriptional regulator